MIIVITNRILPGTPFTSPVSINVADMGIKLGEIEDSDRIHCGILSDNAKAIEFYPKDSESDLFDNIPQHELDKPWVFFVHGFHQDPDENIEKAKAVQDYHGVNVVAFAWPSRPQDHTYNLDDARKKLIQDTLLGTLSKTTLAGIAIKFAKGYLKDFWENYEPAIANAESSNVDLLAALTLTRQKLQASKPLVLLVHSMGNYLLQHTLKDIPQLPMYFNNIVLHEADVNAKGHQWAHKLTNNLLGTAKLYITINMYDGVLAASCARRGILNIPDKERLGQTRHHYEVPGAFYLDFTDGPAIEIDHEIFRRPENKTSPHVFKLLGRVFRAELDGLPVHNSESDAGFSKMPSSTNLFRLQYINEPVPIESGEPDDDILITSLSVYKDHT